MGRCCKINNCPKAQRCVFLLGEAMNRAEFVRRAVQKGYSTERVAQDYADGRDEFTQDDLVAVYAIKEAEQYRDSSWTRLGNGNFKRKAIFYD
jgi:hypothetical protein